MGLIIDVVNNCLCCILIMLVVFVNFYVCLHKNLMKNMICSLFLRFCSITGFVMKGNRFFPHSIDHITRTSYERL